MPITLAELKEQLQKVVESVDPANREDFARKLTDFLVYSLENYEQLDQEAKQYVDRVSVFRSASQAIVDKYLTVCKSDRCKDKSGLWVAHTFKLVA